MTPLEARLTAEVEAFGEDNRQLRQENKLLREKIDLLVKRIFGTKSEQLNESQLMLLLQGGDEGAKKAPASGADPAALEAELEKPVSPDRRPKERGPREPRLPEHLPAVETIVDPDEVKADPAAWRCMGEEVTEQLDYEPPRFFRRRLIRRKYVRRDHPFQAPVIAPLHLLQERCLAAPGLLAAIIVGKYCDHLPLYRQEQIWRTRHHLDIPRQTMVRWLAMAVKWLQPIHDRIRTEVMSGGYVQTDETPIKFLSPGKGKTSQGYLWTCKRPGGEAFFHWATSRAATCMDNIIPATFTGIIQCDGYQAYPAFARTRQDILLAACWAHVRRKFFEAKANAPQHAGFILLQIRNLYRIEAQLRQSRAGPRLRQAIRASHSRMILKRLGETLRRLQRRRIHLPQSSMGLAINYTLGLWSQLQVFMEDGRVGIDNNPVENAIRPTAVGKKNWLFIGEAEAGQRAAILYTLIESCRTHGLDPFAWLRDVLTRLPTFPVRRIHELTPAACAKAARPATPQAA